MDINNRKLRFARQSHFRDHLRARVNAEFCGTQRRGDPRLHRKALIITVWFVFSYAVVLLGDTGMVQLLACESIAFAAAALGFNIFHDAIHGAFSSRARVNNVVSILSCMALGPSRYLWHWNHNVYHHIYTNIYGWDEDIETRGQLRLSQSQPWKKKYRRQHLVFPLLYALSTIDWFFVKDFVQYFRHRTMHRFIPSMTRSQVHEFWICKAIYLVFFMALPFAFHSPARVLLGLLLFHVTLGLVVTFVFQLAHGTEIVELPHTSNGNPARIRSEWAAHILSTTVNFATSNRLLNWFAGGLNFQVEHHLFPSFSHTHYPALSRIVRHTAAEHGLPYREHHTYISAVASHFRQLRSLGSDAALA